MPDPTRLGASVCASSRTEKRRVTLSRCFGCTTSPLHDLSLLPTAQVCMPVDRRFLGRAHRSRRAAASCSAVININVLFPSITRRRSPVTGCFKGLMKACQLDFQSTLSVQLQQGVRVARSPTGVCHCRPSSNGSLLVFASTARHSLPPSSAARDAAPRGWAGALLVVPTGGASDPST